MFISLRKASNKSQSFTWREKYDEAAEKIFTPSKLDTQLGHSGTIHENSEILPKRQLEKWENQLRKPLQNFNQKLKIDIYERKIKPAYDSK